MHIEGSAMAKIDHPYYSIQPCIKVIDRADFEVSQPRAFIGILQLPIYETRLN